MSELPSREGGHLGLGDTDLEILDFVNTSILEPVVNSSAGPSSTPLAAGQVDPRGTQSGQIQRYNALGNANTESPDILDFILGSTSDDDVQHTTTNALNARVVAYAPNIDALAQLKDVDQYVYQSLLIQQPDSLMAFFPSMEQRYQVRDHLPSHEWLNETVHSTATSLTKRQLSSLSSPRPLLQIPG
jgi:hypothetical protein